MAYTWMLLQDQSSSITLEQTDWEDVYLVQGYVQGSNPAHFDLIADRPDLAPGNYHPAHALARCVSFAPERMDDSEAWQVAVGWEISIRGEQEEENEQEWNISPLLRAAKINTSYETVEVPSFKWREGPKEDGEEWFLNTAGDLLEGLTIPITIWHFNIAKNIAVYPQWLLDYGDAVNTDPVIINGLVIQPDYLKVSGLNIGDQQREVVNQAIVYYYPLQYTVSFHPLTWKDAALNMGLYQKVNGKRVECRTNEEDKTVATEPQFLDNDGKQLPFIDGKINPAQIVVLEGWRLKRKPFAALPI